MSQQIDHGGTNGSPLTLNQMLERGHVDALASAFDSSGNRDMISVLLGVNRNVLPNGNPTSEQFWFAFCTAIANGAVPGGHGFERLLACAARYFPGNPHFSPYHGFGPNSATAETATQESPASPPVAETEENQNHQDDKVQDDKVIADNLDNSAEVDSAADDSGEGSSAEDPDRLGRGGMVMVVYLPGSDRRLVIDEAEKVASDLQCTAEVALATDQQVLFHLPDAESMNDALDFADALSAAMTEAGQPVETSCSMGEYRDRLINPLYVEGPDSARFEFNNVPGSTTVEEIGKALSGQYDKPMFTGRHGRPAPTTVDHLQEDGTVKRLKPGTTMDDNEVSDGDTLQVARESTAGANPVLREQSLARAKAQVIEFASANSGFGVTANSDHAPTEYRFTFPAPGWAPPGPKEGGPFPVDQHEVLLVLPGDFPVKAPEAYWQTEIFHPNIDTETGWVCLGDLADRYRPGLDFGELCQTFIDMAAYRNYNVEDAVNKDAQEWALDAWDQIEERGGVSLIRKVVDQHTGPQRQLRVKRISHE